MRPLKIYVTSKRRHAPLLLDRLKSAEAVHVVSRWMHLVGLGKPRPAPHWMQENFDDIVSADAVVVWAQMDDELRLSIGEVYFALAHGKPIFAVGQHVENVDGTGQPGLAFNRDYADWMHYPTVRRVESLEQAVVEIKEMLTRSDRLDQLADGQRRLEAAVHELRGLVDSDGWLTKIKNFVTGARA